MDASIVKSKDKENISKKEFMVPIKTSIKNLIFS
jgi:hypothetical protein